MPTTPLAGSVLAVLIGCCSCLAGAPGGGLIVIDGQFDDWTGASPAVIDPPDAPDAAVDFGTVIGRADGRFLHLLIDLGREVNIQHLRGRGLIVIDADADAGTGLRQFGLDGADIIIELTPPSGRTPGQPGMGIGLKSTTYSPDAADPMTPALTPYDAGITFAPTYASQRTEIRIQRGATLPGTAPVLAGDRYRARLVFVDVSQQVRDETAIFTGDLPPLAAAEPPGAPEQPDDPLLRPTGAAIRLVNWNCELGAIFQKPEMFAGILAALEPVVIHFQEIPQQHTAQELERFLDEIEQRRQSTARWHAVIGEGGGDLRCAIAGSVPLEPVEALRLVSHPDRPDRHLRLAGAGLTLLGKRILLVATHLKCCGYAGSSEDQTRLREVELVRQAIDRALAAEHFDAVVLSGDLNLVGSREPLDVLLTPGRGPAGHWSIVEAYQLNRRSNATWSDRRQPFVPGRLDYVLWSGPALRLSNSFVFDSRDLAATWTQKHGILSHATEAASDHLPVVADFMIEGAP